MKRASIDPVSKLQLWKTYHLQDPPFDRQTQEPFRSVLAIAWNAA